MKKRLLFILSIAVLCGIVLSTFLDSPNKLSDIALDNISAIAEGESDYDVSCYPSVELGGDGALVIFCGTCDYQVGYKPTGCIDVSCMQTCKRP